MGVLCRSLGGFIRTISRPRIWVVAYCRVIWAASRAKPSSYYTQLDHCIIGDERRTPTLWLVLALHIGIFVHGRSSAGGFALGAAQLVEEYLVRIVVKVEAPIRFGDHLHEKSVPSRIWRLHDGRRNSCAFSIMQRCWLGGTPVSACISSSPRSARSAIIESS